MADIVLYLEGREESLGCGLQGFHGHSIVCRTARRPLRLLAEDGGIIKLSHRLRFDITMRGDRLGFALADPDFLPDSACALWLVRNTVHERKRINGSRQGPLSIHHQMSFMVGWAHSFAMLHNVAVVLQLAVAS